MDPNATYDELADLANQALSGCEIDAVRMGELFEALDVWLKGGGFRPDAWRYLVG